MKRLITFITISLLLTSLAINTTFAQQLPKKTLNQAVVDGDIDQVKSEISAGADVNSKNRMGWTLLQTAIQNRQTEIITLLIDKGADINTKDNRGRTPLHFAVETGQKAVIEQLIAKGAEINVMDGRAENALSLAKKNNQKEIVDLLVKHGAQDPDPSLLLGDRLYSSPAASRNPNSAGMTQPGSRDGNVNQSPVAADLLADPNEIKTRVKKFVGLEKSVKVVSDKSINEDRQWLQTRYDDRTPLLRAVDNQIEDEIDFVRTVAVEESAKKTVEAIDSLRTNRQKRSLKVNRELMQQKRDQRLTESASTRGRGRTTARSTRGRTSGTNTTDPVYGGGAVTSPRAYGSENTGRPAEQLDPQTEEQIRLWMQTTPDNKLELARAIHPQIQAEIGYVRTIAVEEKAQKTTAAIDGLLLARKERFDKLVINIEQENRKLQEAQSLRNRTNEPGQNNQQNSRTRGQTSGRTTGTQTDTQQRGTRTRRR
ncbi:MAG: hypothetical protein A2Z38_01495 [Planctomycetes bacterium RBG_19FT_COMBO_48_8]|nr:MAG: hypothetical protein A2Z38_01495 [Planctomycetes bacterium RBG_19FT_COMBO_48_8]